MQSFFTDFRFSLALIGQPPVIQTVREVFSYLKKNLIGEFENGSRFSIALIAQPPTVETVRACVLSLGSLTARKKIFCRF